jgi:hypothetical protein
MLDEDQSAEVILLKREEDLRVGTCALSNRLHRLKEQGEDLRKCAARPGLVGLTDLLNGVEDLQEGLRDCRWGIYELTAAALGGEYNAADVARWCERALGMGAAHPRLDLTLLLDLLHVRKVPNEPFRNRVVYLLDHGHTLSTLATLVYRRLVIVEKACGKSHGAKSLMNRNRSQGRLLERWVGITATDSPPPKESSLSLWVTYEKAVALAGALELKPHEAGI